MTNILKSTETNIFKSTDSNIWIGTGISVTTEFSLSYNLFTYDQVLKPIELIYNLIFLTKKEGYEMAITCKVSDQFVEESAKAEHDLVSDVLKAILLDTSFGPFNPDTHGQYSVISANEIADGNGYTVKTKQLTTVSLDEDAGVNTLNADNISWTASGGNIEAASACVIINETHGNDTVICCIEFGANYQPTTGTTLTINLASGLIEWIANPT